MAVRSPPSFSEELRLMDDATITGHFENLDRRLARVEQILPTLATRDELHAAIAAAVAPLATKEELRLAIAAAVAPLATKEELREEGERSRRHMDIVGEALRSDIQLLAEHVASWTPKPREG
jgi:hypothetical protein